MTTPAAFMSGDLPGHALLLRDFANTIDVDDGADALGDPAALAKWLGDRGLILGCCAGGTEVAPWRGAGGGHRAGGQGTSPHSAGGQGAGGHGAAGQGTGGRSMGRRSAGGRSAGVHGAAAQGTGTQGAGTRGAGTQGAGTQGAGGQGTGEHEADETDLETAIALRTCLRAAMRAHHQQPFGVTRVTASAAATPTAPVAQAASGAPGPGSGLETVAASLPLRVSEAVGVPVLVPVEGGVRGALARLAAAIVVSTADHSWERLKICVEDSCQWAFLDSSKNRSRHWCSMKECGNRSKTRAYRARRAGGGSGR